MKANMWTDFTAESHSLTVSPWIKCIIDLVCWLVQPYTFSNQTATNLSNIFLTQFWRRKEEVLKSTLLKSLATVNKLKYHKILTFMWTWQKTNYCWNVRWKFNGKITVLSSTKIAVCCVFVAKSMIHEQNLFYVEKSHSSVTWNVRICIGFNSISSVAGSTGTTNNFISTFTNTDECSHISCIKYIDLSAACRN